MCSIPRGTRVVWQFIDSEEHNVASDGDGFGHSGERLVGTFAHLFDAPGSYDYGCTIHTEMTGYSIVVALNRESEAAYMAAESLVTAVSSNDALSGG